MLRDPNVQYELVKAEQREALRNAALLRQVKAARRNRPELSLLLLLSASRVLLALSQRLKALAEQQAARA